MRLPNLAPWAPQAFRAVSAAGVFAGVILALWGTLQGYPYWVDELYSVVASQEPAGASMQRFVLPDPHPLLYYRLLAVWTWLFGTSEVATRSLSLLGALGSLGATWWLGRPLLSRAALALASLWLATHWMWLTYAQEARMYGLVLLGGAWVSLGFARLWNCGAAPAPRAVGTFALVSVPAAFLHYSSMALCCSAFLLLLLRHRRRPSLWPPLVLAGALCALWSLWHSAHIMKGGWIFTLDWADWSGPAALLATLWTVFLPWYWNGLESEPSLYVAGGGLVLAGVYAFFAVEWWRGVRREGGWAGWKRAAAGPDWSFLRSQFFLLGLFFAVLCLVHQFRPILVFKMLMAGLPGMALCLGCLAAILWRRESLRLCAVAAVLAAVSLPVSIHALEERWGRLPHFNREGLLEIAARLEGAGPGVRVYCHRCGSTVKEHGTRSLALLTGLPHGTFAPVDLPFPRDGETDERHLIPPFFVANAKKTNVGILRDHLGLEVRVLTSGAPQDAWLRAHLALYVPAQE